MTHPRTRADELSIISSSKPGWELTPLHDATKIIKELEDECNAWADRGRRAGEYVGRLNRRIRELEDRVRALEGDHVKNHA